MGKVKNTTNRQANEHDAEDTNDKGDSQKNAKSGKKKEKFDSKETECFDEEDNELQENFVKNKGGKKESKKTKKVEDDSELFPDDLTTNIKGKSKVEVKGKKQKKAILKKNDSDDEDSDNPSVNPVSVTAFSLLSVDSEPEVENDDEEDNSETLSKSKKGKKAKAEEPKKNEEAGNKKGKKKGKRRDEDDEDIEKMLAELELEYQGKKPEKQIEVKNEEEKPDKRKNRKGKGKQADDEEMGEKEQLVLPNENEENNIVPQEHNEEEVENVKKKKDKKKKKKEIVEVDQEVEQEPTEAAEHEKEEKKKPGKKKVEEAKKDKKGPGKKALAAMQEALKKMKEEEERRRLEEEERERKAAEEERLRQEQLQLERERKELKKQREKEKRERLKAEGKLLSAKQKAQLARAQATLEALRAQGLDVPAVGEKRPRPGTRIRPSKQKEQQQQQQQKETAEIQDESKQEEVKEAEADEQKVEEEEEEIKESWDAESDTEEESEHIEIAAENKQENLQGSVSNGENEKIEISSDESSEDETSEDEEDKKYDHVSAREKALERIQKRREEAEKKRSLDVLRAPVVCVLGHVDTGKTKILDKLRRTHVQDAEAGGITQQIGATNVPIEAIREQSKMVSQFQTLQLKIPGLLIIDTPGHESFSNLRSRGSSLCDIAILVVDIMHGLEPQTIESINLLKAKKTPFVVALNKIDRLYDWVSNPKRDVKDLIKAQSKNTQAEFQDRSSSAILQFAEQGLNAKLFYENPDPRTYISMVPTSAATGDGMGNLMALIVELTQALLSKRLMYSDELQATVLEVKAIPGYGTTIDVILVNGTLKEGDTMVLAGTDGPIVTQIRSLLMPQPMKELRVKNTYTENKEVRAAQGVKITAKDLEKTIAGLNLLVAHHPEEIEICKEEVAQELKSALGRIKLQERGVYVQASTLGSLEALLEFLKTSEIPYSNIRIGPVVKKDVMKASIMLEHDTQYAVILAFDVKIERDAQELADSLGVKIFQADIIYHLFDRFMLYRDELKQKKRDEFKNIAVFPCKLRILPQFIFNTRDPIVVGVIVENGIVKEGTPICIPTKGFVDIGIVTTIEVNHKQIESARKGQEVCIKIEPLPGDTPKLYGRHFDHTDLLYSKISRQSIDACKEYFRDDLQKSDWQLMIELKKLFQIL